MNLTSLSSKRQYVSRYLFEIVTVLIELSKMWRLTGDLSSTKKRLLCSHATILCQKSCRNFLRIINAKGLFDNTQITSLMKNIGHELSAIEVSLTTHQEALSEIQMAWLEASAKRIKPENCVLSEPLSFNQSEYEVCNMWINVYSNLFNSEASQQLYRVDGFAFWIYLRLFASEFDHLKHEELTKLDNLKIAGNDLSPRINIEQYVRSVQSRYDETVSDPDEYIKSFEMYRRQPINGTLLISGLRYKTNFSRWEAELNDGWKIIVEDELRNNTHKIENAVIKQISYNYHFKIINAIFLRNDDGTVTTTLTNNMKAEKEINHTLGVNMKKFLMSCKEKGINSISKNELRREVCRGVMIKEDKISVLARSHGLEVFDKHFIIDTSKGTERPVPRYRTMAGDEFIVSGSNDRTRIYLPLYPEDFGDRMTKFYEFIKHKGTFTLHQFNQYLRNYKLNDPSPSFLLYFCFFNSFSNDWSTKSIKSEKVPPWSKLKIKLKQSVVRKAEINKKRHKIEYDLDVLNAYFKEIGDIIPVE